MKKLSFLLFIFLLAGCLREDPLKLPYRGFTPKDIHDGWAISSPTAEGIDSLALNKVYRQVYANDDLWMMKSLLVFRNGKLLAEAYLKDEDDRTRPDAIWSCTKQVTGIVTGIAISQGYIGKVTDSVGKYLPAAISRHPDKKALRLDHLLTMRSGIAFDNGTQSDVFRQHKTGSSVDYVLGLDLQYPIGTQYYYKDGDPQLVSAIIQNATGMPLDEYARKELFDPLGIQRLQWKRYSDGISLGAFGILTTPRELARIGQCVLDSGRSEAGQLIPRDWWKEMLSAKVPQAHEDAAFGYYWWSIPAKGWYFMWGHGGQYVFLKPAKRLMIVATSLPQVEDDFALWYEDIVRIVEQIEATIK